MKNTMNEKYNQNEDKHAMKLKYNENRMVTLHPKSVLIPFLFLDVYNLLNR